MDRELLTLLWLAGAAAAGLALAWWQYAVREESVPGRTGPAVLRGLAVFLLLGGLALPPVIGRAAPAEGPAVLLDVSRSMALPARAPEGAGAAGARGGAGPSDPSDPTGAAGPSRIDSARARLAALAPSGVWLFGDAAAAVPIDSARTASPDVPASRLLPALEAARLAGADSVVILTDGEWRDRDVAAAAAERSGLGVREVRVAEPVPRLGIAGVDAPVRTRGGDTVRVVVDLRAGGASGPGSAAAAPDSAAAASDSVAVASDSIPTPPETGARVEILEAGAVRASASVRRPAPGRGRRVELAYVPAPPVGGAPSEWRELEVRIPDGDPLGASDRARLWIEVTRDPSGTVVVSSDPDWEPRFLVPVLSRAAPGPVRAYLHTGEDRWLEAGDRPRSVSRTEVERALAGSRMAWIQADPARMPPWLARAAAAHGRALFLARGPGAVPGTGVALEAVPAGEWYVVGPVPPGPAAGLVPEAALEELPPLDRLFGVRGDVAWEGLRARRGRRGESRPFIVGLSSGGARRVVVAGEGAWRWAARSGAPRRAYEGWVSAAAGWLLEEATGSPVELVGRPAEDAPLRWRVAPGVRDLTVVVRDSAGDTVWEADPSAGMESAAPESAAPGERPEADPAVDSMAVGAPDVVPAGGAPGPDVRGPTLPAGSYDFEARGSGPEGAFRVTRPFRVREDPEELLPRALPPPLVLTPGAESPEEAGGEEPEGPRPAWPFVLAAVLLCGEWVWRRRVGLR